MKREVVCCDYCGAIVEDRGLFLHGGIQVSEEFDSDYIMGAFSDRKAICAKCFADKIGENFKKDLYFYLAHHFRRNELC